MKKLWPMVALLLCFALPCVAEEGPAVYTSGDYQYMLLEDGTAQINQYIGEAAEIEIPAELDGHVVKNIGSYAFNACENLVSVSLPNNIEFIELGAFYDCSNLVNVTLPENLFFMSGNPFTGCEKLAQINVSVVHPMYDVVDGVLINKIEKILVTYPCALAASEYTIPQDIKVIGMGAFVNCTNLVDITIPDSVTAIELRAFDNCTSLTKITIPSGVTTINDGTFFGCTSLTDVTIPDGVMSIGNWAFVGCTSLKEITLSNSLMVLGYRAFHGCTGLENITIPNSVVNIGEHVFADCTSLAEITVTRDSYAEKWFSDAGYTVKYEGEWNCNECGTINNRNFCTECGAAKPVIKTQCDSCGYLYEEGTTPKFCPECGTKQ